MRSGKGLGCVCLAVLSVLLLAFPVNATKTDITNAEKKKGSLADEKKKVERTLGKLEALKTDTALYVKQLDENLDTLNMELTFLEGQVSEKEDEISRAQEELAEAVRVEEKQYESMKQRIIYMYEKSPSNFIDILLGCQDFTQFLNRVEYISSITEYDRKMLVRYVDTKQKITDQENRLLMEREQLVELKNTTEAKYNSVEQLMVAKTTELSRYQAQIGSTKTQITEYEKSIEAEENRIRQIETQIKRKEEEARKAAEAAGKKYNTASIGNIKFIWPCPSSNRISSNFGDRESPTEGASKNHQGIDIPASSGSNIMAAAAGEVMVSTYSYSAGNYIMINHGGGVYTVYMHCSQLLASVGDQVSQGQVIAKVGSTGYSTGPHLHFGVRLNGSYVNPLKYVSP